MSKEKNTVRPYFKKSTITLHTTLVWNCMNVGIALKINDKTNQMLHIRPQIWVTNRTKQSTNVQIQRITRRITATNDQFCAQTRKEKNV